MTQQELNSLGKTLWSIADDLRGSMNADDFRDYMLSFLFLRYLSDNYEIFAKKELGADYPMLEENDKENDKRSPEKRSPEKRSPLGVFYENLSEEQRELFEKNMQKKMHYVIKPDYLWNNIVSLAKWEDDKLLKTLEDGFKFIENESFKSSFAGLFSEINLNSEKLGKKHSSRNKMLCTIISKIADGIADFSTDRDTLGAAYEYLIGEFAAGSGKKAGEFYTPQQISTILSRIVVLDCQDPRIGAKKKITKILDMACGSGSLLLNVRNRMGKDGVGQIYGQEKNVTTHNLARMNMLLHGVKHTEFAIYHGDTLTNDWELFSEMNPAKKLKFDAVVANPPFSYKWEPNQDMGEDFRFKNYGLAPKGQADFAFLLHGFHFLGNEGTMAIILPHGVLFRGGAEAKIRTKLLKDGNVDTVIGLPPNLFFSTSIPVCIIVLKKCKKFDDVLFINADKHFKKGKKKNVFEAEHVEKIIATYVDRSEEKRYSRRVEMKEIAENDYNLNITRYVSTAEPEKEIDIAAVNQRLKDIEANIKKSSKAHNEFLRELGLPDLP